MAGWRNHTGTVVTLAQDNIDTDQLIPARFMSRPRAQGYGDALLHDARSDTPDHPLNHATPSVLIAGQNFGSGSSREAAVYALVDFGIRAVIAPSFGDIFASNAVNNGLLPARIDPETLAALNGAEKIEIDLGTCTVRAQHETYAFDLSPVWRTKLINGWDDIDLTRQHAGEITAFADARGIAAPWATPTL